jgi:hypothetical protein
MSVVYIGVGLMGVAVLFTILSAFVEKNSNIERFAGKTTSVIQILFFAGLLISYQNYVTTAKDQNINRESTLTEKNWIDVYRLIQDKHADCPNFVNSLSYDWQKPAGTVIDTGKDNYESVLNISISIFLAFQNVINYFLYYDTQDDLVLWISAFAIWCNSDLLYDMWQKYKFMYDDATQVFTDTIFESVRENRPKNQEDVLFVSKRVCNSLAIRTLFKTVKKKPPCG